MALLLVIWVEHRKVANEMAIDLIAHSEYSSQSETLPQTKFRQFLNNFIFHYNWRSGPMYWNRVYVKTPPNDYFHYSCSLSSAFMMSLFKLWSTEITNDSQCFPFFFLWVYTHISRNPAWPLRTNNNIKNEIKIKGAW